MNFNPSSGHDEPEINLVPLIDILLVILIFFAATTSFVRISQLDIKLPQASAQAETQAPIEIAVSADGRYSLDGQIVSGTSRGQLKAALEHSHARQPDAALLIHADAHSSHESVLRVLEAAQQAGIRQMQFATQLAP